MSLLRSRRLLCVSLLLAVGPARAQVATMSPFVPPPGGAGGVAPTADAPLEFRGVAELPDGAAFRVVDPARKTGAWVRLNQRDPDLGVIVKEHDAAHDTVTVEHQGRTFTLALHQSKVASAGAAMTNAALVPPPPMQVPTIAAQAQPPAASPIQQAQLDAVAAAVAQRRALRDQAAQQLQQGASLAPQVIQQQRAQGAGNQNQNGANAVNATAGANAPRKAKRQP